MGPHMMDTSQRNRGQRTSNEACAAKRPEQTLTFAEGIKSGCQTLNALWSRVIRHKLLGLVPASAIRG